MRQIAFPFILLFSLTVCMACDGAGVGAPVGGYSFVDASGAGGEGGQGGTTIPDATPDRGVMDMFRGQCGNGLVESGEGCDDGNQVAGDGCNSVCQIEELCGNGQIDDGEDCDEMSADCVQCSVVATDVSRGGTFPGTFAPRSLDKYQFRIRRDGFVEMQAFTGDDLCDDDLEISVIRIDRPGRRDEVVADSDSGVGVCPALRYFFLTGVYEVVLSEASNLGSEGYTFAIQFEGICGDGTVNVDESCDDGNTNSGDGCDAECHFETRCGDGQTQGLEECDDGNLSNGDGCDRGCTLEVFELNRSIEQRRSSVGDGAQDTFRFTVDGDSRVSGQTSSGEGQCRPGLDTVMTLYRIGPSGERIELERNDDAPGLRLCSRLEADVRQGTYEFVVEDLFGGDPIDDYVFDFNLYRDVSDGGVFRGGFADAGDDQYRYTSEVPKRVIIQTAELDGTCVGDIRMRASVREGDEWTPIVIQDGQRAAGCDNYEAVFQPGSYRFVIDAPGGVSIDDYPFTILFEGRCGDGRINIGETCDDANGVSGDGCSARCELEDPCGNGRIDEGEACDDGNLLNGDGCDSSCSPDLFNLVRGQQSVTGNFGSGGADFWRFDTHGPSTLSVVTGDQAGGCDGGLQLILRVHKLTADGRVLVDEFNAAANQGCGQLNTDIGAGAYDIEITSVEGRLVDYTMTADLAQVMPAAGGYDGAFVDAGDDHFAFTLANDASVRLELLGQGGCPENTRLALVSQGQDIVVSDNAESGLCSLLVATLEAGDYRAIISGSMGQAIGGYALDYRQGAAGNVCGDGVVGDAEACDDANLISGDGCDDLCTLETFALIRGQEQRQSAIAQGALDTFTFESDGPSQLELDLIADEENCADTAGIIIRLLANRADADNDLILETIGDGNSCPSLSVDVEAGTHLVEIRPIPGQRLDAYTFNYQLARPLAVDGQSGGSFVAGGSDLYRIDVQLPGPYRLSTRSEMGCPGDTRLTVYSDDFQDELVSADGGGLGLCAATNELFVPGQYWLEIEGDGEAVDDYLVQFESQSLCGNNVIDPGEECDDGGRINGDGCTALCRLE